MSTTPSSVANNSVSVTWSSHIDDFVFSSEGLVCLFAASVVNTKDALSHDNFLSSDQLDSNMTFSISPVLISPVSSDCNVSNWPPHLLEVFYCFPSTWSQISPVSHGC